MILLYYKGYVVVYGNEIIIYIYIYIKFCNVRKNQQKWINKINKILNDINCFFIYTYICIFKSEYTKAHKIYIIDNENK